MGIEARVVICLAIFELPIPNSDLKVPVDGLYFYVETPNAQYEISHLSQTGRQYRPEALIRIGKIKMPGSRPGSSN
jgi:hypothetical protein